MAVHMGLMSELDGHPPWPGPAVAEPVPATRALLHHLGAKGVEPDQGNETVAWKNLTIDTHPHHPARYPTEDEMKELFWKLLWHVSQPASRPGEPAPERLRRKRLRVALSASRTLRAFKNERWRLDRELGAIDPVGDALWEPYAALRGPNAGGGGTRRPPLLPTLNECRDNTGEVAARWRGAWDGLRAGGFEVLDCYHRPRQLRATCFPEDEASLWLCLLYFEHLKGYVASSTDWQAIKYHFWRYYNYVLHHAQHRRHRLYCWLEHLSAEELEERVPGTRADWGKCSLLRALTVNRQHAGPPAYAHQRAMLQVIADFYGIEVVLFLRPAGALAAVDNEYAYEAYGRAAHGQRHGQLLLVTQEPRREFFQIVTTVDRAAARYQTLRVAGGSGPPVGMNVHFPTWDRTAEDRWGWIRPPFNAWPVPLPPNHAGPVTLHTLPENDPAFPRQSLLGNPEFRYFAGGEDAAVLQDRPGGYGLASDYGYGRYPSWGSPPPFDGWATEQDPLALNGQGPEFPWKFKPFKIADGIDRVAVGRRLRDIYPRWSDIRMYQAHTWRTELEALDRRVDRHPKSQSFDD
ncbi:hypothetical protein F4780DRAFT_779378 [Xylariomycetidae sp. FL0641]|nr:hypothetical protein F4780DRAFT_779378 [Xylariomycetidae sp. FL0641]